MRSSAPPDGTTIEETLDQVTIILPSPTNPERAPTAPVFIGRLWAGILGGACLIFLGSSQDSLGRLIFPHDLGVLACALLLALLLAFPIALERPTARFGKPTRIVLTAHTITIAAQTFLIEQIAFVADQDGQLCVRADGQTHHLLGTRSRAERRFIAEHIQAAVTQRKRGARDASRERHALDTLLKQRERNR